MSRPFHPTVRTTLIAVAVSLFALAPLTQSPAQADNSGVQPPLVNEQLVIASLDASGLPQNPELTNRIVSTNIPKQQITVNTATGNIRYVDQAGTPAVSGNNVTYDIGGSGQNSITSQALFGKPLPVALHAEYRPGGPNDPGVDPLTVPGRTGTMGVRYTLTNTNVQQQKVTYTDAAGNSRTQEQPVFAPFVGSLMATIPTGVSLVSAPNAVVNTDDVGRTTLLWNVVLYPPLGNYIVNLDYTVRSNDMQVPPVKMELVPVTTNQAPAIGFSSSLLNQSVQGNEQLASGLDELNTSAIKLAQGAAELAKGQREAASATSKAATGSGAITDGAGDLASGLKLLSDGLDDLAGVNGLPKALSVSKELTAAVDEIATRVGNSSNPPISFPVPSDVTLYQVVRATGNATKALRLATDALATSLHNTGTSLSTNAAGAISDINAAMTAMGCPGPAGCTDLSNALTKLNSITNGAAAVELSADGIDAGVLVMDGLILALSKVQDGLQAVNEALKSGSTASPGVYEGLELLTDGLQESVTAASKLATGGNASVTGANELFKGSSELTQGLDQLTEGADKLADGTDALSDGAAQLQKQGTAKIYDSVVSSSMKPAQAAAYLNAAEARAGAATPYPPPAGASARIAYVYSLQPPPPKRGFSPALAGILLIFLAAFAVLAVRRIRRPAPTQEG